MEKIRQQLQSQLAMLADDKYQSFAASLIPGMQRRMWGVRLPALRKIAQKLAGGDWQGWFRSDATNDSFEEFMLRGMVLGYASLDWDEFQQYLLEFVPLIDNWSLCDSCCVSFTIVREHREEAWLFLQEILQRPTEFSQRFVVVMMMDHFLVDEYIERVLTEWRQISPQGYYSIMGLGWAYSVAFVRYPREVWDILNDPSISVEVRKTACQKILESRRTTSTWREKVRELRKTCN